MSRIDELLKDEKVEWKSLGEVCEIKRGRGLKKEDKGSGNIPAILYGELYTTYGNYINNVVTNIDEKLCKSSVLIKKNSLLLPISSTTKEAQIGKASVLKVDEIYLGSDAIALIPNDLIIPDYLMYYLNSNLFEIDKMKNVNGTTIRHLSVIGISSIKIPIPSLETQEKIVKILDEFTGYVSTLQTELDKRTKQYEYYRDLLLSEDYLDMISKKINFNDEEKLIKYTTLGEIGKFTRGNGLQKKDFIEHGKPVIHYGQIYTKYGFSTNKTVSFVSDDVFSKLRKANKNDILIATTSENVKDVGKCVVWLGDEEIGFSGDMYSYRTDQNSKYIAYYFQSLQFQIQKEKKITGTKLIRIHEEDMKKFNIVIPSIFVQNKVVEILDRFQELVSNAQGLIPKEIELRQKQYEYYREKLLSF